MFVFLMLMVLFVMSLHPLEMISVLIFLVFLVSLFIGFCFCEFWFGYLLMLVIVSGVLVLFVYMISLYPNEKYEYMGVMILGLLLVGTFFIDLDFEYGVLVSYMSLKMWDNMIYLVNLFVLILLLSVMLIIVYISDIGVGPVRVS